jgi:UDP-glucose 4-epimerase
MNTCLVLGGSGFIGTYIADLLLKSGYNVKIFDKISRPSGSEFEDRITHVSGDFNSFTQWSEVLENVDYVFHNICTTIPNTSNENPIYDIQTNVISNVRLLQEVVKSKVKKIIFSSSGGTIYGNSREVPISEAHPTDPISSYAISKLAVEKYLYFFNFHYGLDYVCLRYSNIYGEGQNPHGMLGAITIFLEKVKNDEPVKVFGDGNIVRDYVHIKDAARANLNAIESNTEHKIFNIATGTGTSINQLIDIITEVTRKKVRVRYLEKRTSDVDSNVLDISLAKKELNWVPEIKLRNGISQLWAFIQKNNF